MLHKPHPLSKVAYDISAQAKHSLLQLLFQSYPLSLPRRQKAHLPEIQSLHTYQSRKERYLTL